jgi:hypothetical protein
VSSAATTLCVASQRVFIVVNFVIDSVRLNTLLRCYKSRRLEQLLNGRYVMLCYVMLHYVLLCFIPSSFYLSGGSRGG